MKYELYRIILDIFILLFIYLYILIKFIYLLAITYKCINIHM